MFVEKPKAILFDLDGTLVDSVPDLVVALNLMLEALSLPTVTESQTRDWIGNGAALLVRRALSDRIAVDISADIPANKSAVESNTPLDEPLFERAFPLFIQAYHRSNGTSARLYANVSQTLAYLTKHAVPLAIVTNKPIEFVPDLLAKLGIEQYFSILIGGSCATERKPSSAPLLLACDRLATKLGSSLEPEDCLMVGDSKHDIQAARNTGMPVAAVNYGYNHGEDIQLSKPDVVLEDFGDLISYCGI